MKKIFTILCAGILTLGLSAQTDAGNIMLEGNSNLNFTSMSISSVEVDGTSLDVDDDGTSQFGLDVVGGYFFMDGLAGGLILDYSSSSAGDASSSSMTIGPIVRYYIGESGMWGQLSYGIGSSSEDDGTNSYDGPSISALGFGVGYAVWLSDNVAFNPSLGYSMVTSTMDLGSVDMVTKSGGLVFKAGISVHLGN